MTQQDTLPQANLFGIGVNAINLPTAVQTLLERAVQRRKTAVVVSPAFTLTYARLHEDFRRLVNRADLVVPDGMPVVFVCRQQGFQNVGRVYGPDLMLALSDASREHGLTHYYYGGAEGVPEQLKAVMEARFPGLNVVGAYSPPFRALTDAEDRQVVTQINTAAPDIVWVGLGSPKQDYWIDAHRDQLTAPVLIGVGAAFDFHTGRIPQAPQWMQRAALEWLFRLMQEPKRLWQRYTIYNSLFLFFLAVQALGLRHWRVEQQADSQDRHHRKRDDS